MSGENKMHRAIDIVCDPALHSNPAVMSAFERRVRDEHEALLNELKGRDYGERKALHSRYRIKSPLVIVGA